MLELGEHPRICMLYGFKLGHSANGAYKNLIRAYGKGSIARSTVARWFAKFRCGNECLENASTIGLSTAIDDDELEEVIRENPKITHTELSKLFGVGKTTVFNHLKKRKEQRQYSSDTKSARRRPAVGRVKLAASEYVQIPFMLAAVGGGRIEAAVAGDEENIICIRATEESSGNERTEDCSFHLLKIINTKFKEE
ncbi:unnamed protein product [Haemonchus placei]|uniref:HTH_48 domain-containing protein n=1 Tax=Haemonchus placei TaxID=6290 RepID=A0A0N4WUC8_HAEPC|nr:unnamed protein product [Haemonchus placei]